MTAIGTEIECPRRAGGLLVLGILSLRCVRTAVVIHERLLWFVLNKPYYHHYESNQDKEAAKAEYPGCDDADNNHYHADDHDVGVHSNRRDPMNVPCYGAPTGARWVEKTCSMSARS
jgi:hypothetical protein